MFRIFQAAAAAALLAMTPASAKTVTLDFEGTLSDVKLSGFAVPHSIAVGDTFAMSVTFDTDVPIHGTFLGGAIGVYQQAVTELSLTLAGMDYALEPGSYDANTPNRNGVANDGPTGDELAFSAPLTGPDLGGETVGYVSAAFLRGGNSALGSIDLSEISKLATLPSSIWAEQNFFLHFGTNPASGVARLDGEFTSVAISSVPLPATGLLLGTALFGIGAMRRRKAKSKSSSQLST